MFFHLLLMIASFINFMAFLIYDIFTLCMEISKIVASCFKELLWDQPIAVPIVSPVSAPIVTTPIPSDLLNACSSSGSHLVPEPYRSAVVTVIAVCAGFSFVLLMNKIESKLSNFVIKHSKYSTKVYAYCVN